MGAKKFVVRFDEVSSRDGAQVGGKNAALGEMIRALKKQGVRVPDGFATTADAFRFFVRENKIDKKIRAEIERLKKGTKSLKAVGKALRALFLKGKFPERVEEQIRKAYRDLCGRYKKRAVDVAVRSSATAEDLPEASFAGQQETFLNISGQDAVVEACRNVTHRSLPVAQSAIAKRRVLIISKSRSRPACRKWCAPTKPASCFPSTPRTGFQTSCASAPPGAWAKSS